MALFFAFEVQEMKDLREERALSGNLVWTGAVCSRLACSSDTAMLKTDESDDNERQRHKGE